MKTIPTRDSITEADVLKALKAGEELTTGMWSAMGLPFEAFLKYTQFGPMRQAAVLVRIIEMLERQEDLIREAGKAS